MTKDIELTMEIQADKQLYETELSTMWLDDHGILCSIAKKDIPLTIDRLKVVYEMVDKMRDGKKVCCLTEMSSVSSGGTEVRQYAKTEMEKSTKALALISKSTLGSMIANVFLTLHNPSFPTKMFTDPEEAKEWLRRYL